MAWPIIHNNIFFTKEFINKLMSHIPQQTMEYWDIVLFNADRTEGLIRYDGEQLDVIYIMVNCKYQIEDTETTLKFNYVNGDYQFDSIYIRYDIRTHTPLTHTEYRYDKDLNIIGEYHWNKSLEEYLSNLILCTQYKNGIKLKEYMIGNNKSIPTFFNKLADDGILNLPNNIDSKIDYMFVKGNYDLIYYNVR
jgi:hypothetical protein